MRAGSPVPSPLRACPWPRWGRCIRGCRRAWETAGPGRQLRGQERRRNLGHGLVLERHGPGRPLGPGGHAAGGRGRRGRGRLPPLRPPVPGPRPRAPADVRGGHRSGNGRRDGPGPAGGGGRGRGQGKPRCALGGRGRRLRQPPSWRACGPWTCTRWVGCARTRSCASPTPVSSTSGPSRLHSKTWQCWLRVVHRKGNLQCLPVTGELITMFTGKHLVLNGVGVVDDQNIQISLLPIYQVWPCCLRPMPGVAHRLHSGLTKKACEETVAKAVAAPWSQPPSQHVGVEFLRAPESTAASKFQFADKVKRIELVALFRCKFLDLLSRLSSAASLLRPFSCFSRSSASTFARCAN